MVSGKIETSQPMGLLKKRVFLLDNGLKITIFKCSSDCLRMDRSGDDIDEMGSPNSIVKLSSGDLTNKRLFVTSREL
jgi:hypothetical protein